MATHLTEGQKAPAFTGKDQNGKKNKKQANRIVGKKKLFILMIPLLLVLLAFVLSTISAAFWGKENLGMSY